MKRLLLTLLAAGCAPAPTLPNATSAPLTQIARFALLNGQDKVKQDSLLPVPSHLKFRIEGKATVVVAAFQDNQADSLESIPPLVMHLQGEEQSADWVLPKPQNGRLYVAILPEGCANAREISKLIDDWKGQNAAGARKNLYARLTSWERDLDPALRHEGEAIEVTGGVTSHSAFNGNVETSRPKAAVLRLEEPAAGGKAKGTRPEPDWRPMADSVECNAEKPGVYSYPIRFATR